MRRPFETRPEKRPLLRASGTFPLKSITAEDAPHGGELWAIPASALPPPPSCTGDCNDDDTVAINELIIGVNIALGRQPLANCPEFDPNTHGGVEIDERVTAVSNALNGCGG